MTAKWLNVNVSKQALCQHPVNFYNLPYIVLGTSISSLVSKWMSQWCLFSNSAKARLTVNCFLNEHNFSLFLSLSLSYTHRFLQYSTVAYMHFQHTQTQVHIRTHWQAHCPNFVHTLRQFSLNFWDSWFIQSHFMGWKTKEQIVISMLLIYAEPCPPPSPIAAG